jgi:AraC-like DNA-binding protein
MSRKPSSLLNNHALLPDVRITVSVTTPSGGGSRDPRVLLNDSIPQMNGRILSEFSPQCTYDTYDGQNKATSVDWYALEFPYEIELNCIEMTMGFAYPDGGWWRSLHVEIRDENNQRWRHVEPLTIHPDYDFTNERRDRLPYSTFALMFPECRTRAVRIIGEPGGSAQFTSLARLGVYLRPTAHPLPVVPPPPIPYIFRLISPETIWKLSESLIMLSGLMISFPLVTYYWDENCHTKYIERMRGNYQGEPDLWFLVNDTLGWNAMTSGAWALTQSSNSLQTPSASTLSIDVFSAASAPVLIEGQSIGNMVADGVIVKETFDLNRHRALAKNLNIPWSLYRSALARSPHLTLEQLHGVAGLMGAIANTIANLAHHNLALETELDAIRQTISQKERYQKEIVRRSIQFMNDHLEDGIRVHDVARSVAVSEPQFNRLFGSAMGRSPGDYLIDLKLERAKEYLAHTRMSIMDVCTALNYSPSYFCRLFKQRVGCTPGEYLERHRQA